MGFPNKNYEWEWRKENKQDAIGKYDYSKVEVVENPLNMRRSFAYFATTLYHISYQSNSNLKSIFFFSQPKVPID